MNSLSTQNYLKMITLNIVLVFLTCWFAKYLENEKSEYHTYSIFKSIFIKVIKKFHSMEMY